MLYLALGCAALASLLWLGRSGPATGRGWRIGAGALSVAAFAGAAFLAIRGGWGKAIVLGVVGLWLAVAARQAFAPQASQAGMSLSDARAILGVGPEASSAEVQAAYLRLMQRAHPDRGGTDGLAAQLNAARATLLGKRR